MTAVLYGIPNCDTVKKARTWLDEHGVAYDFHDFKKAGVNDALLSTWLAQVPLTTLLNRKGTTWRKLSPEQQAAAADESVARTLMIENPSLIKRPVLVANGKVSVGFTPDSYASRL
ncbi:ArsC family reductase [Pandoraea fibrosis]|uniref:ArsC family reductase n=1 Tax=Pandoraea fibrosis TaxID=1891094 RepID=A0A5E4X9C1_9BURK|nr:ArsC family reductase [Pandoraea fibrosis]QHE92349.1 ArsC family reductase [Pandoraea fibrosis]QHF14094.1 ArsC family reductase [Pandoraea fibrosis]VVE32848.1 arsenate reductase [Pandoraea fibrosis]